MPTSELSNALNPYASQSRQRPHQIYPHSVEPAAQQQSQYVPHVSQLETAISQPLPHPQPQARQRQGAQVVNDLLRMLANAQKAQEAESKRRLAWEREQEEKYLNRQQEMEKQMQEMSSQLIALRAALNSQSTSAASSPALSNLYITSPQVNTLDHPASPVSPVSQISVQPHPMFVQGSSSSPSPSSREVHYSPQTNPLPAITNLVPTSTPTQPIPQTYTPDPSPQLTFVECTEGSSSRYGKRKRKSITPVDDGGSSSDSTVSSTASRPRKRRSHHDTRCYTIHHALRSHILRMMEVETDKELPDSHIEGTALPPDEPIRFVWDKTTKQSVHNLRMKTRVLDDIKEHRRLYKHVPSKEFNRKNLEVAFDQCFVTFRQKFKAQRDRLAAQNHKQRENAKAQKSRRISRKKMKLDNRAEARQRLPKYHDVTFDGALQIECMSSEESDVELDPETSQETPILRTRGYTWRSRRLVRLYAILDLEDRADSSTKPKRGSGKKERRAGPPKEGFYLPPQGVAAWMVSQRWYKESITTELDLEDTLDKRIVETPSFDWTRFHDLGEESEDEDQRQQLQQMQEQLHQHQQQQQYQHQHHQHQQLEHQQLHHALQAYNPHIHNMNLVAPHHQHYNPNSYINYTL